MIVQFIDSHSRDLGRRVMDTVPRAGESVCLDGEKTWIAWSVGWQLYEGEQVAWVSLRTPAQYEAALWRDIRTGTRREAAPASPTREPSPS